MAKKKGVYARRDDSVQRYANVTAARLLRGWNLTSMGWAKIAFGDGYVLGYRAAMRDAKAKAAKTAKKGKVRR